MHPVPHFEHELELEPVEIILHVTVLQAKRASLANGEVDLGRTRAGTAALQRAKGSDGIPEQDPDSEQDPEHA